MIDLKRHADGVLLPVRARPGAKRSAITGAQGGMLKVAVTAAPEKGKANQAIIELLCETLSLARSQVALRTGQGSRSKQFLVRGLTSDELARRIAEALPSGGG